MASNSARLYLDIMNQALLSLGDRQFRTFLSVMGIAIGIAAVTLIGVVTSGGKEVVFSELQTFGLRSAWISRDHKLNDPHRVAREGTGITNDDYKAIRDSALCKELIKLTPIFYGGPEISRLVRSGRAYSQTRIEGVGYDYLAINNDTIAQGRPFTRDDIERGRRVVIIGHQVQKDLFGELGHPLGKELRLNNERFEIIGVLADKDRSLLSAIGSAGGQDANGRLLLPYLRLQTMANTNEVNVLQAEVAQGVKAKFATDRAIQVLKGRHRGAYEYRGTTMEQHIHTANGILDGVSKIGIVAASVSLFVAGLGILNIMSTSVLERTREIGIRKALGGSEREILLQFMMEAAIISSLGGMIGLVLGGVSSVIITRVTGFPLLPSMGAIVIGFLVAIIVGLLSGIYPAYRAAQLRPVEALRYE